MLINTLAWIFGTKTKSRRRPRGGGAGDELAGWVVLIVVVLIFLG